MIYIPVLKCSNIQIAYGSTKTHKVSNILLLVFYEIHILVSYLMPSIAY